MPPTARPLYPSSPGRRLKTLALCGLLLAAAALAVLTGAPSTRTAAAAQSTARVGTHTTRDGTAPATRAKRANRDAAAYVPQQIVVGYASTDAAAHSSDTGTGMAEEFPVTHVLSLPKGANMDTTLAKLRREKGVAWAVPNYVAHTSATTWIPNDTGLGSAPGGWQQAQWNFDGTFGVNAPQAWANVAADGAPGAANVVVAVLDTGVAYANRGSFRRSPDFGRYSFVQGYDFITRTPYASDRNGHGTFVAGTIAEATNNGLGMTGLAFAARIMPVRVLDNAGEGDASVIAEGVRFAVNHGARVINLSLEFSSDVTAADIPELMQALRYAYRHNVVVVAASGNEGLRSIPYPAHAPHVIAVGATTEHGCLADYSDYGPGLTLVAPGGGPDASLPGDPNCHPESPPGRDIYQMTFTGSNPRVFGFPANYEGTSMATPHVTATVAMIIAAHILGRKPTVAQITARLKATARPLGGPQDHTDYGAGLLDAAAATERGGPGTTG